MRPAHQQFQTELYHLHKSREEAKPSETSSMQIGNRGDPSTDPLGTP